MEQTNLFGYIYDKFYFCKKHDIQLFEAFAGVGMQRMAMEKISAKYTSVGISEIDEHAIKSYMAIHGDTKNFGDICKIGGGVFT